MKTAILTISLLTAAALGFGQTCPVEFGKIQSIQVNNLGLFVNWNVEVKNNTSQPIEAFEMKADAINSMHDYRPMIHKFIGPKLKPGQGRKLHYDTDVVQYSNTDYHGIKVYLTRVRFANGSEWTADNRDCSKERF